MAKLLEITHEAFVERYLREVDGETSLRESTHGDCVFLQDNQCRVHAVRPQQCRTYPFWFKNLRSEDRWRRTCSECPGIGRGRLYGREEILARVADELDGYPG
jgi:Fe-S-cluster containining protein